jgi:hypothetical protein
MRAILNSALTAGFLFLFSAGVSQADTITFNFNSPSLPAGASTSQIQTYMDGVLTAAGCTGCKVTVTGAYVDSTYNADGNVTGPGNGSTSYTLGDSDGPYTGSNTNSKVSGTDNFLATTNQSNTSQSDTEITMKFSGFTIATASFDYEIFPNINCTSLTPSGCGGEIKNGIYPNQPDFVFATNLNSDVFTTYGVAPGTTNGNAVKSPDYSHELAPQYIGTTPVESLGGASQLDFIDWPATIGVDNLTITTTPEPYSIVLLGTIALAFVLVIRKRRTA